MIKNVLKKIILRKEEEKNQLADKLVLPLPSQTIVESKLAQCAELVIDETELEDWVKHYFPSGEEIFGTVKHKKLLELFISFKLLNIQPEDVYMDAAGGQFSYASSVQCRERIIQDLIISEKLTSIHKEKVRYIESESSNIPLEEGAVNKISCHHSIEHFQEDGDILFIREVQRLLAGKGKCVIVPVFLSSKHFLITDTGDFRFWTEDGERLLDESATLPGGTGSGNFSRVYSLQSFHERILKNIDRNRFSTTLLMITMNGKEIPDEKNYYRSSQAKINFSYRALLIERIA